MIFAATAAGFFGLDNENTGTFWRSSSRELCRTGKTGLAGALEFVQLFQLARLVSDNPPQLLRALHFVLECAFQFCNPFVLLLTLYDKISCSGCSFQFLPG